MKNKNKALVIIDVQNFFAVENAAGLPAKIAKHIHDSDYGHLLFTKMIWDPETNFEKILHWRGPTKSPEIDIHNNLLPFTSSDNVFQKTSYSAFKSKEFTDYLKKHDITELDICGINIDACVLSTAFEAFDLGFNFKVLEELSSISSTKREYSDSAKVIIRRNMRSKN
jgi:nicotinamidase-related amidase